MLHCVCVYFVYCNIYTHLVFSFFVFLFFFWLDKQDKYGKNADHVEQQTSINIKLIFSIMF